MTTPHERAVENAGRTTIRLGDLFDRIGHTESRRGIFRAYRNAVASIALASAGGGVDLAAFDDIAAQLRQTVELVTDGLLQNAIEMGIYAGINDAEIYGLVIDSVMNRDIGAPAAAIASTLAALDAQIAAARALLLLGEDAVQIIGDPSAGSGRAGVLTPAPVTSEVAHWIVLLASAAHDVVVQRSIMRTEMPPHLREEGVRAVSAIAPAIFGNRFEGYDFAQFGIGAKVHEVLNEWGRQAVAVIDERTTDCCLRVHGQWQAFGDDFRLTGTPRYADTQPRPPFHKWCRSATALVQRKYAADDLTTQMRDAARAEINARKTQHPRRKVITPANAFSRRA